MLADRPVLPGDVLVLKQRMAPTPVRAAQAGAPPTWVRLEVAYEDEHMAVVVKPQGMPTQVGHSSCVIAHDDWGKIDSEHIA